MAGRQVVVLPNNALHPTHSALLRKAPWSGELGRWASKGQMNRILLISLLLLSGCGPAESTRQDLLSCLSPNKSNRAVFYRLYGGGAAGWQTLHVSVQSGTSAQEVVLSISHGYDVELAWQGNTQLTVTYPSSATVIESKQSFSGGAVSMRSQSSTTGSLAGGSQCVVAQQGIQADGLKPAA